jgi:hypothetical protein
VFLKKKSGFNAFVTKIDPPPEATGDGTAGDTSPE